MADQTRTDAAPTDDRAGSEGPSKAWYVVGLVIAVVGLLGGVLLVVLSVPPTIASLTRMPVPGTAEVSFDEPGIYTVFHEMEPTRGGPSPPFETFREAGLPAPIDLEVTDLDTGRTFPAEPPRGSTTYTMPGIEGRSVAQLAIPAAGEYEVTAEYTDGVDAPRSVLSIDAEGVMGRRFAGTIVGGVALAAVSLIAGGLLALVVALRRSNARRTPWGTTSPPPPPPR